jgi:WhiB family redox-sensing transcriptional regulator
MMQATTQPSLRPDPWPDRAACKAANPAIFFPPGEDNRSIDRQPDYSAAKAICATCDVRAECAAAGANERYGVWGGTTPAERGAVRRRRRRASMTA